MSVWRKVVFAHDLPDCSGCGEKWCPKHKKHYCECSCIGPTQDGVEYKEIKGVLFGKLTKE
jgi:hypothetical protein